MWKSVSAIFIESARIPQNTARIPRRIGILQEFTQNTEAFKIPLKNTARNTRGIRKRIPYSSSYSEYGKEYGIVHAEYAQNTTKSSFGAGAFALLRIFDHRDRDLPISWNWVAIPIKGLVHNQSLITI